MRVRLPRSDISPAVARTLVRETLVRTNAPDELMETAVLLASEVVTNAVRYGDGDTIDVMVQGAHDVYVVVEDRGAGTPVVRPPGRALATEGRGLRLVDELSDAWGTTPCEEGGKAVWFELRRNALP